MKQVLSIQDLSCLGRCSLTVALPVISAMGSACAVLPTAVLSTHTGFPQPHVQPLTEHIAPIHAHWQSLEVRFDAVSVGYLASPAQAAAVAEVLRHHRARGSRIIADPAMGDHGRLYSGMVPEQVDAMRSLCRSAHIVLPNVTEAALLTGLPYREQPEESYLSELAQGLLALGVDTAIVTGFLFPNGQIGFYGLDREAGSFSFQNEHIHRRCHGTGDLFAAAFTGALMQARSVSESARLAARFVGQCVAATPDATPYGVEFESQLPRLWRMLEER